MNSDSEHEPGRESPSSAEELGRRIALVVARFRTQADAARVAGVSLSQLKRYMSGKSEPPASPLAALARDANISLEWVIFGDGPMALPTSPIEQDAALPAKQPATDAVLLGRLVDRINKLYKEMGQSIPLHQAGEMAARLHDEIVAALPDADMEVRLGAAALAFNRMRDELRHAAAHPAETKRSA